VTGASRSRWVEVFCAWRPNLPGEPDNQLIELAVAAQVDAIVTRDLRDVARGELKVQMSRILTPEQCSDQSSARAAPQTRHPVCLDDALGHSRVPGCDRCLTAGSVPRYPSLYFTEPLELDTCLSA
jgi:hypothetical protein